MRWRVIKPCLVYYKTGVSQSAKEKQINCLVCICKMVVFPSIVIFFLLAFSLQWNEASPTKGEVNKQLLPFHQSWSWSQKILKWYCNCNKNSARKPPTRHTHATTFNINILMKLDWEFKSLYWEDIKYYFADFVRKGGTLPPLRTFPRKMFFKKC